MASAFEGENWRCLSDTLECLQSPFAHPVPFLPWLAVALPLDTEVFILKLCLSGADHKGLCSGAWEEARLVLRPRSHVNCN